jgi:hypothetical protein
VNQLHSLLHQQPPELCNDLDYRLALVNLSAEYKKCSKSCNSPSIILNKHANMLISLKPVTTHITKEKEKCHAFSDQLTGLKKLQQ